ncbi:PD-(D/E)XK nuclease family protein [Candidatus Poribacteria bacterium]|nr:PD-(D/E)XK nuclease family protein [Candidatus Poribacteria bacterium]
MLYKLSPSTLKYDFAKCPRCFWLKLVSGLRAPSMFFPPLFNRIHSWIYEYMASVHTSDILPDMPAGRLIHTERGVKSLPIQDTVILHGRLDGIIELDSGGYCVLDIKTTDKVDRLAVNYSLQLNTYAYCLEHSADGVFSVAPVKRLGILAFMPNRFAVRHQDAAGIAGSLKWIEVEKDERVVGKALGEVLPVLRSSTPPESSKKCEWCRYARMRVGL